MRNNPIARLREARARAYAEGTAGPVAFFWDDPELLTVDGGDQFEIHFNDMIDDWYGISSSMIVEALIAADGRDVLVHLNSPGGMVTEGLSIHSQFKQYAGKVTMRVEGLAASAASFVMLAADEVVIEPNAMVMIHDAWDITIGPAAEHRKTADLLDKISNNIAGMYAAKADGDVTDWRAAMLAETWYIGQEAVDAGLVDTVTDASTDGGEDTGNLAARWSGIFAKAPHTTTAATTTAAAALLPERLTQPLVDLADRHSIPIQTPAAATAAVRPAATLDVSALHNALKGLAP